MKMRKFNFNVMSLTGIVFLTCMVMCTCTPDKYKVNVIKPQELSETEEKKTTETEDGVKKESFQWVQKPLSSGVVVQTDDEASEGQFLMNFEDIPIPNFIDAMMTGIFKKGFILSDKVKEQKKKITIKMTEDVSQDDAFRIFEKILEINGIGIKIESGIYIFSVLSKPVFTFRGAIVYGRKIPEGVAFNSGDEITFLIPLYNVTPDMLQNVLKPQLSSLSIVSAFKEMNLLVLNGKYEESRLVLSLVELLDRAQFQDKSILMLTPRYWHVDDLIIKLKELLDAEGLNWETVEKSKSLCSRKCSNRLSETISRSIASTLSGVTTGKSVSCSAVCTRSKGGDPTRT